MTLSADGGPLISVRDLSVVFPGRGRTPPVHAVKGISFDLSPGEILAIVGESGSGKSVTARSLVGLAGARARVAAERFDIDGRDALSWQDREWRVVRGRRIGLVLQDALVSLDPLRTVASEVREVLGAHDIGTRSSRNERVLELLASVGIPDPALRARQHPHELSGGLRQRALIATAIAGEPAVIIADEPTTALDVSVQAQILTLLKDRRDRGTGILLISHDLAVVSEIADRILVMKDGRVVEEGATPAVLASPSHEYTRLLLDSVPSATKRPTSKLAGDAALSVAGVAKTFGSFRAVQDVSFEVLPGETVGIVGESGSGKTTVARIVLGLLAPDKGQVRVLGEIWSDIPERHRRTRRHAIQAISQDSLGSFDPRHKVGRLLAEALTPFSLVRKKQHRERCASLLERVGLGAELLDRYPRELSGGQRQRVSIARALATEPTVLICDEPVSALDVSVQAQVLELLADLQARSGTAMVFISHDLGVIRQLSDRVLVMREGVVVEQGDVDGVFNSPKHEYTQALLDALPVLARQEGDAA